MSDDSAGEARPVLRVVRGEASPEDIAVITALLAAAGEESAAEAPAGMSLWRKQRRNVRMSMRPGPDSWRASGMPH